MRLQAIQLVDMTVTPCARETDGRRKRVFLQQQESAREKKVGKLDHQSLVSA